MTIEDRIWKDLKRLALAEGLGLPCAAELREAIERGPQPINQPAAPSFERRTWAP